MELKTIDARVAKTNVTLYNKQQELKDQEEKVRRIHTEISIFGVIR